MPLVETSEAYFLGGEMEFSLVTKGMKKMLWVLMGVFTLFFAVMFVLMINDDIKNGGVSVLKYAIMGTVSVFIILITYVLQRSAWSDKRGKITIDERGAEFRARAIVHFIPWDRAEYVIIGGRKPYLVIYIQTDSQRQKYKNEREKFPYYEWNMISPGITSDDMVYVPYSREALDEIKKYHYKPIINEYLLHMRGWRW